MSRVFEEIPWNLSFLRAAIVSFGSLASARAKGKDLIWHRGVTDSETGGEYTVKVYESEKAVKDGEWEHKSITLKPLNPKYDSIVLTPTDEGDVRVLAEFVEVVGAAPEVE